jgi:ABC-type sugar transport system ATPase subunit
MNLLDARVDAARFGVNGQAIALDGDPGPDGEVTLGVRPSSVRFSDRGIAARVELVEHLGDTTIVDLDVGEHLVKMRSDTRPSVARRRRRPRRVHAGRRPFVRPRVRRPPPVNLGRTTVINERHLT